MMPEQRNVLGGPLQMCSVAPMTGFYRTGKCETGPDDHGRHCVCVLTTEEFLAFSKSRGNDLSTPMPEYRFPGLKPGDRWCLCSERWKEAYLAGKAPLVVLEATHESVLEIVPLEVLEQYAATGISKLRGDIMPN
jgi:uncharacterized protein (DUF2237 family)